MAEESAFREVLSFFDRLGVFDVVLPFLLIFTIVFAMLEKTKVLGTEGIGEMENLPKKNLNAMVAFVIAFFTIASSQLVALIIEVSANVIILMLAIVFFLLLLGSFHNETKDPYFLTGASKNIFMAISALGLLFIFLNALETDDKSWFQWIMDWITSIIDSTAVAAVVLFLVVVGIMGIIVFSGPKSTNKKTEH